MGETKKWEKASPEKKGPDTDVEAGRSGAAAAGKNGDAAEASVESESREADEARRESEAGEEAESREESDLLSLDDLFAGAQGGSCSIDGTCD
ncbi:hypothetical protein [Brevibacterium yomogidense]|uniref:hypothetical protein n=1 Tax=Brevibacterium yomogidense TaxID=946573 RepID=UPI0018DFFF2C|nr:hypothetical protein [Brevibacterium yomogidense]